MLLIEQVEERFCSWSVEAGVYKFKYKKNGETYNWICTPGYRRECLRAITLDAGNPELSLDYRDAATITARVREVVPVDGFTPAEVEPAGEEWFAEDGGLGDCAGVVAMLLLASVVFWAGFIFLAVRAVG